MAITLPTIRFKVNPAYAPIAAQISAGVPSSKINYSFTGLGTNGWSYLRSLQSVDSAEDRFNSPNSNLINVTQFLDIDAVSFFKTTSTVILAQIARLIDKGAILATWLQASDPVWTPDPGGLMPLNYVESAITSQDIASRQSPWITREKDNVTDDPHPDSANDYTKIATGFQVRGNAGNLILQCDYLTAGNVAVTDGSCTARVYAPMYTTSTKIIWKEIMSATAGHQSALHIVHSTDVERAAEIAVGRDLFVRLTSITGTTPAAAAKVRIRVKAQYMLS